MRTDFGSFYCFLLCVSVLPSGGTEPAEYFPRQSVPAFQITDAFISSDKTLRLVINMGFLASQHGSKKTKFFHELTHSSNRASGEVGRGGYEPSPFVCRFKHFGKTVDARMYRSPNDNEIFQQNRKRNARHYETVLAYCQVPESIVSLPVFQSTADLVYYDNEDSESSSGRKREIFLTAARKGKLDVYGIAFTWNASRVQSKGRSKMAVCTCVYKVDEFLPEWILYHYHLGFSKVYIFDDSGNRMTRTKDAISGFIEDGMVEYLEWPMTPKSTAKFFPRQISAMNSCLQRFGRFHEYIFVGDSDEFLVPAISLQVRDYAEGMLKPLEAGRTIMNQAAVELQGVLDRNKGRSVSMANVDVGGDQRAALLNSKMIIEAGDRECKWGVSKDREKTIFYVNFGNESPLIIDQGHNVVLGRTPAIAADSSRLRMHHYWSPSADQSCPYVALRTTEGTAGREPDKKRFSWIHTSDRSVHTYLSTQMEAMKSRRDQDN